MLLGSHNFRAILGTDIFRAADLWISSDIGINLFKHAASGGNMGLHYYHILTNDQWHPLVIIPKPIVGFNAEMRVQLFHIIAMRILPAYPHKVAELMQNQLLDKLAHYYIQQAQESGYPDSCAC